MKKVMVAGVLPLVAVLAAVAIFFTLAHFAGLFDVRQECEQKIEQKSRELCYYLQAKSEKNARLCDKSSSYRPSCYLEVATLSGSMQLCEKINATSEKSRCYWHFIENNADVSFCDGMVQTEKERCLSKTAFNLDDSSLCSRLSPYQQAVCLSHFAVKASDLTVCGQSANASVEDYCYLALVWPSANVSGTAPCDRIRNSSLADSCYYTVSHRGASAELCGKIKTQRQKDGCLFILAQKQSSQAPCEGISEGELKQRCMVEYALSNKSGGGAS